MLKESFSVFTPSKFYLPFFLELHKRADSDTPAKYPYSCCCHNRELGPENTTNSSAHNENYVICQQVKYQRQSTTIGSDVLSSSSVDVLLLLRRTTRACANV